MAMSRSFGCDVVDDPVADHHLARRDRLEAGDHAQRGRLPASRRADEHEELALGDLQAEVMDGVEAIVVDLVDVFEYHGCHGGHHSARIGGVENAWR